MLMIYPSISKILEFYLFADDTSIYVESDNLLTLQKIVNGELRKVKKWLEAKRLALSIIKQAMLSSILQQQ